MFRLTIAMTLALLAGTTSVKKTSATPEVFTKKNAPNTGEQWQTMPNGVEFQPAGDLSPLAQHHLRRLTNWQDYAPNSGIQTGTSDPYSSIFIDGSETYYDEYAQAWRALGFYIDCDYCEDENGACFLYGEDGDEDEGNQGGNENDGDYNNGKTCQRFMLWAAYIDEDYSGNGVGEYAYWDRKKGRYDYTACDEVKGDRCVKMNCHEPGTHFKLLGFFKEPGYDEWMEQLFKHEGDCVWTDREFEFMQRDRESWPKTCTMTNSYDHEDQGTNYTIYYDLKPEQYGDYGIGLYKDDRCSIDYDGDLTVEAVLQAGICSGFIYGGDDAYEMCANNGYVMDEDDCNDDENEDCDRQRREHRGNVWSLDYDLKMWNDAFDVYKQCQPCKAHDLTNYIAKTSRNSTGYRQNNFDYDDQDEEDGQDGKEFSCHDDAGYDSVNQCMKFATHTKMLTATWRDVEIAGAQGTITSITLPHAATRVFGSAASDRSKDFYRTILAWLGLLASAGFLAVGYYRYVDAKADYERSALNEPLVPSDNGVVA